MGFAEFIEKKLIGKKMCVYLGEDVETIIIDDQHWLSNKAFFTATIESVEDGIVTLIVENNGTVYVNCEEISAIWPPSFDYHRAVRTSLTRRMVGALNKV